MSARHSSGASTRSQALVTVFEDLATANTVVQHLHEAGVPIDKIELVTHSVREESPEVQTPKSHETTASWLVGSAIEGGKLGMAIGAGAGLVATVVTAFPGFGLGLLAMGTVSGAIVGGMGGVDRATRDDTVDLPTVDEYQQLVDGGHSLVVVLGTHQEVESAKEIIQHMPHVGSHVHYLHGHEFHEHPTGQ